MSIHFPNELGRVLEMNRQELLKEVVVKRHQARTSANTYKPYKHIYTSHNPLYTVGGWNPWFAGCIRSGMETSAGKYGSRVGIEILTRLEK